MAAITLHAHAKINLDLRILGSRGDGYHDLRTVFQTIALHDVLTFTRVPGRFAIECDDPTIPIDQRNLIWKAASILWRTAGRARGETPRGALVQLKKRIPAEAGLGGGSADAAVALVGLARIWSLNVDLPTLSRLAGSLGADVPYFLVGGTALGLGRGDDIYPLTDMPHVYVVLVKPHFGVSTVEAYSWYDDEPRHPKREPAKRQLPPNWPEWSRTLRNDLEPAVASHHPTITHIKQALIDAGATLAMMSGSGSAMFGVFERADAARRTARDLARPGWQVVSTRTLTRSEYARSLRLALATTGKRRIR